MAKKCGICEDCEEKCIGKCIFCKNDFCEDGAARYIGMCGICYREPAKKKACEDSWLRIPLPTHLVDEVPKEHHKNDIARIIATYLSHIPESPEEKAGGGGGK